MPKTIPQFSNRKQYLIIFNNSINGLSASAKSIFFISFTFTHFEAVCSDNVKSPLISLHLYAYKVMEKSSYGSKLWYSYYEKPIYFIGSTIEFNSSFISLTIVSSWASTKPMATIALSNIIGSHFYF